MASVLTGTYMASCEHVCVYVFMCVCVCACMYMCDQIYVHQIICGAVRCLQGWPVLDVVALLCGLPVHLHRFLD